MHIVCSNLFKVSSILYFAFCKCNLQKCFAKCSAFCISILLHILPTFFYKCTYIYTQKKYQCLHIFFFRIYISVSLLSHYQRQMWQMLLVVSGLQSINVSELLVVYLAHKFLGSFFLTESLCRLEVGKPYSQMQL